MNNEPRQPIEEALQAYAGERRRAAGEPFAMPPHVRSQLHREIARSGTLGADRHAMRRPSWMFWLAQPWAWGTMACLILVGIVSWQWLGSGPVVTSLAKMQAPPPTKRDLVAERENAPPPAAANSLAAPAANGPAVASPKPPAVISPAANATPAGARTSSTPKSTAVGLDSALRDAATPVATASAARPTARFAAQSQPTRLQQVYRQDAPQPQTRAWQNFRVEQVGTSLQVVDAEGSVYPARLLAAEPSVDAIVADRVARAVPSLESQKAKGSAPLVAAPRQRQAGAPAAAQAQGVVLVAEGTNTRLQQRVVLTGNLLLTNAAGALGLAQQQQALPTNEAGLQFLLSNSRFEGQVTFGATNQFPVLAVPSGP